MQQTLHRVLVLNEGHFDYGTMTQTVPVTIGSYDPSTSQYQTVATISGARFATCILIDGQFIYVAADSFLLKYDKDSYQLLNAQIVKGIRKIAVWNNQLLISRGEYGITYNSYFQVYDKNDLHFVYELNTGNGPAYASEGIVVKNDSAYIAVNNGFDWGNEVGYVGVVDLNNHSYTRQIDLGSNGHNPENIIYDANKIVTVNNKDYSGSSVSEIDMTSNSTITTNLATTNGCTGSAYINGDVVFQTPADNFISKFHTSSQSYDSVFINRSIYGMAHLPLTNQLFVSETDYTSYGIIYVYTPNGQLTDAFCAGVAPGNFAFDVRNSSDVNNVNGRNFSVNVFPNPSHENLTIQSVSLIRSLKIINAIGQIILSENNVDANSTLVDINQLASGNYFVSVVTDNGEQSIKISKK